MYRLQYISNNGSVVEMDGEDIFVCEGLSLKGDYWSYELKNGIINKLSREAVEIDVSARFLNYDKAKEALGIFNKDNIDNVSGRFMVDEWYQEANIVGCELEEQNVSEYISATLKVVLKWGYWLKMKTYHIEGRLQSSDGLDFSYDHEYDFQLESNVNLDINIESKTGAALGIIFYGNCVNPSISIADNTYCVQSSANTGERITIDPYGRDKIGTSIYKTGIEGQHTNLFQYKYGGEKDSGSYIFQKIPSGIHKLHAPIGLVFDLIIYEESGTPPWI